jgi:hypothetical protein
MPRTLPSKTVPKMRHGAQLAHSRGGHSLEIEMLILRLQHQAKPETLLRSGRDHFQERLEQKNPHLLLAIHAHASLHEAPHEKAR